MMMLLLLERLQSVLVLALLLLKEFPTTRRIY
jgi:hypothetical protein